MDDRFLAAVEKTIGHEGAYVDDPYDPGGETRFGISKRSYPHIDIQSLTREQAEAIYREDFWEKYGYGRIENQALAEKVFDLSVNLGPWQAHVLLQIATGLTGSPVCIDGIIGPETLGAVNGHPNPGFLLATIKIEAVKTYISRDNERYEQGWVKRAVS